MNIRSENQMRLSIVGASGMVGGYALRYMLDHPGIARVKSIGRRKLGISHPKLNEVLHQDFSDCSALAAATSRQDVCVFCLGAYAGTVPDARRIGSFAKVPTVATVGSQSMISFIRPTGTVY
jgi:uncharacterized protein YbjT (DUF2867 family)